jgi:hypothetical protein
MQQPECTLVDVARFQSEGEYQLKLVRRAVHENNIEDLHAYARAIKAMPIVAGFNLRPIGRAALVDAVELGNQAAVHALVIGFDLTASDIEAVKGRINNPKLADCLDCELLLLASDKVDQYEARARAAFVENAVAFGVVVVFVLVLLWLFAPKFIWSVSLFAIIVGMWFISIARLLYNPTIQ